jgi:hypothetical protein
MTTPKAAISEALDQLDQKNDALWTDDGSPIVAEVQRLCNDKSITRAQINDASPGFARKMVSLDEKTQEPVAAIVATDPGPLDDDLEDLVGEDEQPREMLARHVREAELAIQEAKKALAEAHRHVVNCERIHSKKLMLYNSKFPPISAAQNIKDHLARQQEILYERVTGEKMPSAILQNPIDATMSDRKRSNGRNRPAPAPYLPRKAAVNY